MTTSFKTEPTYTSIEVNNVEKLRLTDSGEVNLAGTGRRITGDFTNATVNNRTAFQTNVANSGSHVIAMPNGTSTVASLKAANNSDLTNCSFGDIFVNSTEVQIRAGIFGTGTFLPMVFNTNGSERMRIDTSGNVGIGTNVPSGARLAVYDATSPILRVYNSTAVSDWQVGGTDMYLSNYIASGNLILRTNGTERMRIDSSGNVGIGTSSPTTKLQINAQDGFRFDVGSSAKSYMRFGSAITGEGTAELSYTRATGVIAISAGSTGSTLTDRLVIDNSGNVLVTNAAGLGYGTGAGGTVTQATSKSTAVTLNKPCGRITMNNAALAAGATVTFDVNNSLFNPDGQAKDVAIVNAYNNGNYRVEVRTTFGSAFRIAVTNVSGGSLSEALVINFVIIKGATS